MKKFENILLVTDIDGTLVDRQYTISEENKEAAKYFMENGGKFTYGTGRQVAIARHIIDQLLPNAPIICYNGTAIYDYLKGEYLWYTQLDDSCRQVIDDVLNNCPEVNVEINALTSLNVIKRSDAALARYESLASFFQQISSPDEVEMPWLKLVFVLDSGKMTSLREYLQAQPYYEKFNFSQSASFLFELLPSSTNKGIALEKLNNMMGDNYKTIAIGDNENDIEFLEAADVGFAVANATPLLLKHSPRLTVHQKDHAVADIVDKLDKKII